MAQKTIVFTRKDLQKRFIDYKDCPIFNAMKRAGIPLYSVGSASFTLLDCGIRVPFSKRLIQASNFLALHPKLNDRIAKLHGKRFQVRY